MAYGYYRVLTIDHTKVPNTDRSNFPVLISGTYAPLKTVVNGGNVQNSSGYDIAFFSDSALTTQLKHETERYIASTGEVIYWVKVPTVATAADTVIYMAYGDSTISTDQSDKTNVWDSNFKTVYHLPDGTTLTALDSTSNALNGTIGGSAAAGAAKIGGGVNLDGSNDVITTPATGDYNARGNMGYLAADAFTLELWYKGTDTAQNGEFGKGLISWNNSNIYAGFILRSGYVEFLRYVTSAWSHTIKSTTLVADGNWHHIALVNFTNSTASLYIDGAAEVSAVSSVITDGTPRYYQPYNIGSMYNGVFTSGLIDEVRISSTSRSADWITTTYNNQNSPSTFYSVGSEIQVTPPIYDMGMMMMGI